MATSSQLPPIERWWPKLGMHLKHEIRSNLDQPLSDGVLDEIEKLLGQQVPRPAGGLSEHEKGFIRTQGEAVD